MLYLAFMSPSSANDRLIALRLPESLDDALVERAEKQGVSKSALIRDLLAAGLREVPSTERALKDIQRQLKGLRADLKRSK